MKLEMLPLVLRRDCLPWVLTVFSTILVGEEAVLGAGAGEQPDHLLAI
jgi:hypothetical protein